MDGIGEMIIARSVLSIGLNKGHKVTTEHKIITLNENDIKELIAEKFDCDLCNVEIETSHGDPQYLRTSVYIEVDLN